MNSAVSKVNTVLLADDDEDIRNTLRRFFAEETGYRVIGEACDGMGAVEQCRMLRPDLVLLDIQMPILDGIRAAQMICGEELAHCVVMLTAFSDRDYIQAAIDAGAYGYLTKPIQTEKIMPTLELCLNQSKENYLLRKNRDSLNKRLDDRETVDRAKLALMESKHMQEAEAYTYLRELSRRKSLSMKQVAVYLLTQLGHDT